MIVSCVPKYTAILALLVLGVGALDTFIAAVYEHAVTLPNRTETPVLEKEALLLMHKNIDVLETAVKLAARQVWLGYWKGNLKRGKNGSVWNLGETLLLRLVLSRAHISL